MLRMLSASLLLTLLAACTNYGAIVGSVYDAKTRQPLNNVVVSVGSMERAHSSPDGTFTLTKVPIGNQTLTVSAPPGYLSPPPIPVSVQQGQTAPVPAVGLTPAS